ncbi:MAG: zinc finger-like domain-containing protein [Planctomycetota bacterium]|jgi:hypothetical protein
MRRAAVAVIALGILTSSLSAQDEAYKARRAALKEGDHESLLELGIWCLGRGGTLDKRARECFEDLFAVEGDVRDRAVYRLALWHLNRGCGYADLQHGVHLLAELARKGTDIPASREVEVRKQLYVPKKREMVEKAMRTLVRGQVGVAARILAEARRLPFGRASGEPDLDASAIYDSIARALADSEREAKRFADPKLPIDCPKCSGSGFEPCKTCKGKGTIRTKTKGRRVMTDEGLKYEEGKWVTVKCAKCQGSGKKVCPTCRAVGVDFSLCDEKRKRNYIRFGTWLKNLSSYSEPRRAVEMAFEEVVKTKLNVPASLAARVRFPLIPPTREKMDLASLKAFWEKATQKDKYDLIRGITVLAARWLEPFFFHAGSRKTLGVKEPFLEKNRVVPLPPEVIGADPHAFANRWVRVVGEVDSNRAKGPWMDDLIWISLNGGEGGHNLRFFIWNSESREKHRILSEINKEFTYLKRFLWTYPFQIEDDLRLCRRNSQVVLYGRMIHRPGAYPSQAVEVWSIDVLTKGKKVHPPKEAPPDPTGGGSIEGRAALYHARALDIMRAAGNDEVLRKEARAKALEALREAIDFYQRALTTNSEDLVLQEGHARTLHLLYRVLEGGWWPL